MMELATTQLVEQSDNLKNYYRFQSRIYDMTRWSFLFGRNSIMDHLPASNLLDEHLVEVGCGTGYNLEALNAVREDAWITGLDVSADMLQKARKKTMDLKKVRILEGIYGPDGKNFGGNVDGFLFSYSLSMMNPGWNAVLDQAYEDLKPGGWIAVVDFHNSKFPFFKNHMSGHHVRMDGHLTPWLKENFTPHFTKVGKAYQGIWEYFQFVGVKK